MSKCWDAWLGMASSTTRRTVGEVWYLNNGLQQRNSWLYLIPAQTKAWKSLGKPRCDPSSSEPQQPDPTVQRDLWAAVGEESHLRADADTRTACNPASAYCRNNLGLPRSALIGWRWLRCLKLRCACCSTDRPAPKLHSPNLSALALLRSEALPRHGQPGRCKDTRSELGMNPRSSNCGSARTPN